MIHTSVERILPKLLRQFHKVALDIRDLVLEASMFRIPPCLVDLVLVVVDTNNVHIGKGGNLACGAPDTTPYIEHAHTRTQLHLRGKVVLMTSERLVETFPLVEAREMEGGTPSVLVHLGRTVVVTYRKKYKISTGE